GIGPGGAPLRNRDPRPARHLAHGRGIVHAELLHEERENVAAGVAHEAIEHPLAGNDGEVAVRAPVKGTRGAEIRPGALELDVLADDPHDVRRLADLLDHVIGNEAHARNSTSVTPWPPWFDGAKPKRFTRGSAERISCTSWRRAPVPLPWITRSVERSARMAPSSALTSSGSASETRRPIREISVAALTAGVRAVEGGGGWWRAVEGDPLRTRFRSSNDIHPSPAFSPAVSPAVSSSAFSTSRRASLAVASSTAARARPSAASTFLRASSR